VAVAYRLFRRKWIAILISVVVAAATAAFFGYGQLLLSSVSFLLVVATMVAVVLYWLDPEAQWSNGVILSLAFATALFLGSLMLPAVLAVKDAGVRVHSLNNLKAIAVAAASYQDLQKRYPPAALRDDKGNPLLSWRVLILPFLGEKELFDRFKLDEPWDSPHNLELLPLMPTVFAPPPNRGVPCGPYETFYQGFVGPGTIFEDRPEGVTYRQLINGSHNTILVAEAGEPVPWTKPADLVYDPKGPLPSIGGLFNGQNRWHQILEPQINCVNFAYADGSVQCVYPPINEEDLRAGIERNSGKLHMRFGQ
jgi:hypothetical protein